MWSCQEYKDDKPNSNVANNFVPKTLCLPSLHSPSSLGFCQICSKFNRSLRHVTGQECKLSKVNKVLPLWVEAVLSALTAVEGDEAAVEADLSPPANNGG